MKALPGKQSHKETIIQIQSSKIARAARRGRNTGQAALRTTNKRHSTALRVGKLNPSRRTLAGGLPGDSPKSAVTPLADTALAIRLKKVQKNP
ncbi:hypothetical protein NJC38_17495 [Pseudomonas sp. 21LCFQ010]|uniref:hypothetical protein n=1 Tax=Pseudomonas sp. 21LCFQ010 TaxID=2957506 RepID=UPI0020982E51|nr:hypothetical protein [Pseudomonas sp. 21LCFQ010]MCO8163951.1 hypothetical protein [Pseudomonas sp. 21LCFQ010]